MHNITFITNPEIATTSEVLLENDSEQICGEYENYTLIRFLFLSISSCLALFGAIANIFLFFIFTTRKCAKTPPTLYPRVLALLDMVICTVYILLFGADAAVSLFILYHIYIVPAFVISRIAQIAIPYMLIFATLERFVWISGNMQNRILRHMYSVKGRYITVVTSLLICMILRLPTAWATTVYDYPKCSDFFRSKTASAAPWVRENLIYHVYDFHLLSIAQTVVPFFLLFALNIVIVKRLLKMPMEQIANDNSIITQTKSISCSDQISLNFTPERSLSVATASMDALMHPLRKTSAHRMSTSLKSAIHTMLCIVASYLLSNTLHLILTVLERSNSDLLKHPTDPNLASTFHTIFSDLVSFVYMFTSAIRIMIYYVCNQSIRCDILNFLG